MATTKKATKKAGKYKTELRAFQAKKREAAGVAPRRKSTRPRTGKKGPRDTTLAQTLIDEANECLSSGDYAGAARKLTEARTLLVRMDARTGRRDPSVRGAPPLVVET